MIPLPPVLLDFPIEDVVSQDTTNTRGYIYGDIEVANNVDLTLGLSYDDFDGDTYDLSETNPKLGVTWDATEDLQFRAAYFKILKPVLASNRTLEPTQVAGFNQFYDDATGTVKVTVAVEDGSGLRPGAFVRVDIVTDTHPDALVVSRSALVAEGRRWHLYRLTDDDTAVEQVEVTSEDLGPGRAHRLDEVVFGEAFLDESSRLAFVLHLYNREEGGIRYSANVLNKIFFAGSNLFEASINPSMPALFMSSRLMKAGT